MILKIVPEVTEEVINSKEPNEKLFGYKEFNDITVHPFIATNNWECIRILLNKGIHSGYIKQLVVVKNRLEVFIKDDTQLDFEIISRCCEVFPDKAPIIKKTYMSDKDNLKSLLKEVGVIFD